VLGEVLEGVGKRFQLDPVAKDNAHKYVSTNVACLAPWVQYCWLNRKSTLHIVQVLGFYGFGPFGVH